MVRTFRLSKSKIIAGLQCPRRLWYEVHQPELAVYDAALRRRFAGGHEVGALARRLFAGGILIESQRNLSRAVRQTQAVLAGRRDTVVFEGAFRHRDVLVRADVITRVAGHCRLIEVKSATQVKPYHVDDAAIQAWVISGAGLPLAAVAVAHIDAAWVYGGDGDYRGLLREVDVTAAIQPRLHELPAVVRGLQAMVAGHCPVVATGEQCHRPFDCPFLAVCTESERVARPRLGLPAAPVGAAGRPAAAAGAGRTSAAAPSDGSRPAAAGASGRRAHRRQPTGRGRRERPPVPDRGRRERPHSGSRACGWASLSARISRSLGPRWGDSALGGHAALRAASLSVVVPLAVAGGGRPPAR
jgi:hypothetical protein